MIDLDPEESDFVEADLLCDQLRERFRQNELSQTRLDRDLPQAGDTQQRFILEIPSRRWGVVPADGRLGLMVVTSVVTCFLATLVFLPLPFELRDPQSGPREPAPCDKMVTCGG